MKLSLVLNRGKDLKNLVGTFFLQKERNREKV